MLKNILGKIDSLYLNFDKKLVLRTRNITMVPDIANRRGSRKSYGEWCHVIGIFQTLLFIHLSKKMDNVILDVGCGTGTLGIASAPFLEDEGKYIGIDVRKKDIAFCKKHFPENHYSFMHLDVGNRSYAPNQPFENKRWDIPDTHVDALTALSVWTHLNEEMAKFYFLEINRVLKPGGVAIVTFFRLDGIYYKGVQKRTNDLGKYHRTKQSNWIFDKPSVKPGEWFPAGWTKNEEDAIGVTDQGIKQLTQNTNLDLEVSYIGNWKEVPGVFFQDVLVFRKSK